MKEFIRIKLFTLALFTSCFCGIAANAQVATFDEMKLQLNDKSLPIINMVVEIGKVSKPEYTDATIEIADPQMRTDNGCVVTAFRCKVKYRGNSSLAYEKKSFAVKLLDENGKKLDANMFGIREDDAWILNAMAIDRLRMRDRVNFDIWNEISNTPYSTDYECRNGTKGLFVELFVNGEYHGLYCFTDKINRKLLNVKKPDTDNNGNPVIRGVMYKSDGWCDATTLWGYNEESMEGASWNKWKLDYPDDYPCTEAYSPLKEFIDYCSKSTDEEFRNGIDNRFYWDNFVDYHTFLFALGIRDALFNNSYLSITNIKKGRCFMVTPWDLDTSLGGDWDGKYHSDVADPNDYLSNRLFNRLWHNNVKKYKETMANRWWNLYKTKLSEDAFSARLDAYANAFIDSGAWQREYDRWNGNPVELQQDLMKEVEYVKDWYHRNCEFLRNNVFHDLITDGIECVRTNYCNDGDAYNVMGQKVDDSYKGFVIKGGQKIIRR